jgi:DNA-binding MarR family transcriptional regulator
VIAEPQVDELAAALRVSVGLLLRRLRQEQLDGELTLPESSALARLERGGPSSSSALAALEQISPQSMGATLAGLASRGLIDRIPDPGDGRRCVISISPTGLAALRDRRNARTQMLARALASSFTRAELDVLTAVAPLLERLAQSI